MSEIDLYKVGEDFLYELEHPIQKQPVYSNNPYRCQFCEVLLIADKSNGFDFCPVCGNVTDLLPGDIEYKTSVKEYPYRRINNFINHLRLLQCKKSVDISTKDFKVIRLYTEVFGLDNALKYLSAIKGHNFKKYKTNINFISHILLGSSVPMFDRATEGKMIDMFKQLEEALGAPTLSSGVRARKGENVFQRHCQNRRNFLSYNYILYKFCQILGVNDDIKNKIKLLKSQKKLKELEHIFENVCKQTEWKFTPVKR